MNNIFKVKQTIPYDLKKRNVIQSRSPNSVKYDTETISYIAPKIWSLVPETMTNCKSVIYFKQKIKKWKPIPRLIAHVDYVKSICNMLFHLIIKNLVLLLSIGKFINRYVSCIVFDAYWLFMR